MDGIELFICTIELIKNEWFMSLLNEWNWMNLWDNIQWVTQLFIDYK